MKLQSDKAAGVRQMVSGFLRSMLYGGALLAATFPMTAFAREHGSQARGGGESHYSTPSRGRTYVAPRSSAPAFSARGYAAPRVYEHGYYGSSHRGYAGGGVYVAPYSYGYSYYDPGYAYAPAPAPCTAGSYDRYGNWIPAPGCYPPPAPYGR